MHRTSLLSGIPYNVIVVDTPQRFQAIDGVSAFGAGVRLIPFNLLVALGSVVVNLVAARTRIPPIFFLFAGSILELTGIALLSSLPDGKAIPSAVYGYEALAGFDIGMMFGMCLVIPPHVVEARDLGESLIEASASVLSASSRSNMINNILSNSHLKRRLASVSSIRQRARPSHCIECNGKLPHSLS